MEADLPKNVIVEMEVPEGNCLPTMGSKFAMLNGSSLEPSSPWKFSQDGEYLAEYSLSESRKI